ncbi:MAG: hypothetical protein HQ512_13465 [Rhodospirillales bacterium]|nr:hypothetical protein [Rhodospirillales bacterium]
MQRIKAAFHVFGVSAVLLTGACGAPEAYIYKAGEFNREAAGFGKDVENIDYITVCYNKLGTKPEIIAKIARAECERFNKKSKFIRQSYEKCPLVTPVAAIYKCLGGEPEGKDFKK